MKKYFLLIVTIIAATTGILAQNQLSKLQGTLSLNAPIKTVENQPISDASTELVAKSNKAVLKLDDQFQEEIEELTDELTGKHYDVPQKITITGKIPTNVLFQRNI